MYSDLPKGDRVRIVAALSTGWLLSTVSGVASIVSPSSAFVEELGKLFPVMSGFLLIIGGIAAFIGVTCNRYYLEWIGASLSSAGLTGYIVAVWATSLSENRLQAAASLSVGLLLMVARIASCAAHAKKKRLLHEAVRKGEK